MFDEFAQKLTTLYGDRDTYTVGQTEYDGEEVTLSTAVWDGADGTRVALNKFEGKAIRIAYASGDFDALLDNATIGNLNGL